jgi:uncharacterized repeat protein (TIGR03809 family)
MTTRHYPFATDDAARKWRDLAERRRSHFVELYKSGRWKRYYTEENFIARMRQAVVIADRWAAIAPRPEDAVRQAAE